MKIVPVVLSGGAGTRLWPASRQTLPKPFMKLGGRALLQQALERGQACGADDVLVVTNKDHLFLTQNLISGMTEPLQVTYLLEPKGRNTAPAITLAALACQAQFDHDTVMLVLPADHLIPDSESFVACALEAARHALNGQLVVFGVNPTGPETGFGYIEVAKVSREAQPALRFVEKPDQSTAQAYLATGRYYWNSGMFCFTAQAMLETIEQHSPEVFEAAQKVMQTAVQRIQVGSPVTNFDAHTFGLQPDISIDYAVMERANNVTVVPAKFAWSDVGSWPAVAQAHTADANGNTMGAGDIAEWIAVDTQGTHVHVDSHGHKVVATVGVQDLVVVDTPDALLVAHKRAAQNVKCVVDALKERQINSASYQTTVLPSSVYRPWGTYATLKEEGDYKVKRIAVRPGQSLSLQYHDQRSEHWVVVQGQGVVQVDDCEYPTQSGQYHHIPVQARHRLTNIGAIDLLLIEVQCGDYLGEDDIVRLADTYGRV